MKKDFLTIDDIQRTEILKIFDLAAGLKKKPRGNQLKNKIIAFYFEIPSIWARMSFETGIKQLSGDSVYLDGSKSVQNAEDTTKTLNRYVDAIIGVVRSHDTLETMSKITDIHVINALSNLSHPCQVLSHLFTIKEKFGDFKELKLAYVGDGNNICNSLLLGCAKVGMNIDVACPNGFEPNSIFIQRAIDYSKISKCDINIMEDPVKAVKDANIIYNDTLIGMNDEKEKERRLSVFLPKYQVNQKLLNYAASDVLYMHCLPANRDEEVTQDVIDGTRSIVWDQAENRLHVQKALLIKMIGTKISF